MLSELPPSLQLQVSLFLLNHTIRDVTIFKTLTVKQLLRISQRMAPMAIVAGVCVSTQLASSK